MMFIVRLFVLLSFVLYAKSRSLLFIYFILYKFLLFRAKSMAYGSSQARSQIGATAAGLSHSHRNGIQTTSVTYTTP